MNSQPSEPRRFLRFSLRGLLIATAVLAVPIGWCSVKWRGYKREQAALAALEPQELVQVSVNVPVEHNWSVSPAVHCVYQWQGPAWLEDPCEAVDMPLCQRVVDVSLYGYMLNDHLVEQLARLSQVEQVTIFGSFEDPGPLQQRLPDARITQVPLP